MGALENLKSLRVKKQNNTSAKHADHLVICDDWSGFYYCDTLVGDVWLHSTRHWDDRPTHFSGYFGPSLRRGNPLENTSTTYFYKDQKIHPFGKRAKPPLMTSHTELFKHPRGADQYCLYFPNQQKISSVAAIDLITPMENNWKVDLASGISLITPHLHWGLSPVLFLELNNIPLPPPFEAWASSYESVQVLYLTLDFDEFADELPQTLVIPQTQIREGENYIAEWTTSSTLSVWIDLTSTEEGLEEEMAIKTKQFKATFFRLFPQLQKKLKSEFVRHHQVQYKSNDVPFAQLAGVSFFGIAEPTLGARRQLINAELACQSFLSLNS